MPRLPGPESLGAVPSMRSGRGAVQVGSLETGDGAIAQGLGKAGNAMVGIAVERKKEDDALDLIKADAHLQQGLTELNRQFETDPDHATFGDRFADSAARIRGDAEAMIRNPQHRERWLPRADTAITSSRDRVLGRGTALAREERFDEIDGILTSQRNSYLTAPDDATRDRIRRDMDDSVELGSRSGLLLPRQARELRRRHVVGAMEDDARESLWRDPYATLRDLTEGDRRAQADSTGGISDQGLAWLRRGQTDAGNLTPTQRQAADRRLREETASLSTFLNENTSGLTQLQHDALVSYGFRRGQAALDALLPDIQQGNWDSVSRTMLAPREPVLQSDNDPGYRVAAGKGPSAYSVAQRFVGTNERQHADVLAEFFRRSAGQRLNPAQTAWCMAFVNAAIGGSGAEGTGTLMARDALRIGTPTRDPQEGDIVVMEREGRNSPYGHVGFFVKRNPDGSIDVLSGNAGEDGRVSVDTYPAEHVLGYRTPPRAGTTIPGVDVNAEARRNAERDNERGAQEAEMVLGRAPSPRFAGLPPDRRRALVTQAQVALRSVTQQELGDEVERIRRTGEMERDQAGMTALDRARRVLTPNQYAKAELAITEAQRTFAAISGLNQMTENQAAEHLNGLAPANQSPDESYRTSARVQDRATRAWQRISQLRQSDPAQAVSGGVIRGSGRGQQIVVGANGELNVLPGSGDDDIPNAPAPEVRSAMELLRRRRPEVSLVQGEDGSIEVQTGQGQEIAGREAWKTIFDARLVAQARLGIPDYQLRVITRAEGQRLLDMPADAGMNEREFTRRLRAAADRAEQMYGPQYARQALEAALSFRTTANERREEANSVIARLARNENVGRDDIERLGTLDRIDRIGRLWEGQGGLEPNYGRPELPAIFPRNDVVGEVNAIQGRDAERQFNQPQPNDQQRAWLLQNIEQRSGAFDEEFGPGAAARTVYEARRQQR